MNKDMLKMLANKLMFNMNDEEYDTLLDEFDIILKQMDLIGNIDNISNIEPMVYNNLNYVDNFRDDVVEDDLSIDDILLNSGEILYNQVKLPKVVE